MLKDFVKRDLTALEEKIGREKEQQDAFMEESGLEGADVNYLRKQFLSAEEAAEAKAEELEDIRIRKSRKTDWDEYVDAPRRWGRAMHHSDLIYNLRRLIPNLYVIDGMVRNTLGLYVWDRNKKFQADPRAAVKVGGTTRDIASQWPSAKEAWGYEEEDQAAANLWGHGLGLAQYDQPVISRIWSLDHPIEIKEGMVFALETQHGKPYEWGVRIEEMLIVHKTGVEIVSNFPVNEITVVDPMPGYSDYGKRAGQ